MNTTGPSDQMASLYVGDLHPDVTEQILFDKFSAAGTVNSIRLMRDRITRHSLGYAYVNFQQPADAEKALDTMNFDKINGEHIRIMWSQRDSSLRNNGVGNVFINNLDKTIDNKAVYDTFSAFGNVLSSKVISDGNGSTNHGFVHFETEEAARTCIDKVNGMLLNGKIVYVGKFISKKERIEEMGDKTKKFTNIYIENLGGDIDDDKLRGMFEVYGKVISAKVMTSDVTSPWRCGSISFEGPESAKRAVDDMNGKEIHGGRPLYVVSAQEMEGEAELKEQFQGLKMEQTNRFQGVNLYVKNLDDVIDDERLRKEFSQFGTITSAKVMTEGGPTRYGPNSESIKPGRSKGFGFVCFRDPEEANRAVAEMHGRIIVSKPLYVALAQRKEDRRAYMAAQYIQGGASIRMQGPQVGQMFQPSATQYFVPQVAPQYPGYFTPAQMAQVQAVPRWNLQQVRPAAQPLGFQTMQGQVRQERPAGEQPVRGAMSAYPTTGQQAAAAGGQRVPPMAAQLARPPVRIYPTGPPPRGPTYNYTATMRYPPATVQQAQVARPPAGVAPTGPSGPDTDT